MALTSAALGSGSSGSGGFVTSVATSGSTSPTANRLIIAAVHSAAFNTNQAEPPDSITGAGLTFTLIQAQADIVTSGVCVSLWRALTASPSTGVITATWSHSMYFGNISVFEIAGIDTSGTNGSGAIVQSVGSQEVTGSATTSPVTLSAFGNAGNGAVFATGWLNTGATIRTCTPDTGWTEVHDFGTTYAGAAAASALETQFRASNDTSATGTWSAAGYLASMAAEIKAASAGTAVSPLAMAHSRRRRST